MKQFSLPRTFILLYYILVCSTGCKKETPLVPTVPPSFAKPVLTYTLSPSVVDYGDSTSISFSSTGTEVTWKGREGTAPTGTLKLRLLTKDTTLVMSTTGPGGTVTYDIRVPVIAPNPLLFPLTSSPWQLRSVDLWIIPLGKSTYEWAPVIFFKDDCLQRTKHYFYIDKRYYSEQLCSPDVPKGYAKWAFLLKDGRPQLNRGGDIMFIDQLTADTLKMSKEKSQNTEKFRVLYVAVK